jgi:arylsulfatase A-like enzyme
MDRDVGRILDLLVELGIAEDTLVIFTSDNGPCPAGGQDPRFFNSNGPLKGGKRSLYEGGIRVPTIAWWPGTVEAGTESDHPSAFWDMMPTFADLAGVETPPNDGISIVPTLRGNPSEQQKHEYLYWTFRDKTAVRFGPWKAVKQNGKLRLYNLSEDIAERNDLSDERPELVQQAEEYMQAAKQPLG